MFSFIKWIELKWQDMKRNKGLWYLVLTIISLIGIFISLYFVNFLVSDVAKKTYESQKNNYTLESKVLLENYNSKVLALATAISQDGSLQMLFQSDDVNKTQKLSAIAQNYTQTLNQALREEKISVGFTYNDKMLDSKSKNGLVVDENGVAFLSSIPLAEKENVRLGVVVKNSIASLKKYYNKEKKECALLLNRGAYTLVDAQVKAKNYANVLDNYYVDKSTFDSEFILDIKKANLKQLMKDGYIKDLNYFFVSKKVYNYNGQEIGILVVGQKINEKNSFVNLIKNLVNSVTIVALGLIVSMILFLF